MIYRPRPLPAWKATALKDRIKKDIMAGLKFEHVRFTKQDADGKRIEQLLRQKAIIQQTLL